jgi:hypothetical protein
MRSGNNYTLEKLRISFEYIITHKASKSGGGGGGSPSLSHTQQQQQRWN